MAGEHRGHGTPVSRAPLFDDDRTYLLIINPSLSASSSSLHRRHQIILIHERRNSYDKSVTKAVCTIASHQAPDLRPDEYGENAVRLWWMMLVLTVLRWLIEVEKARRVDEIAPTEKHQCNDSLCIQWLFGVALWSRKREHGSSQQPSNDSPAQAQLQLLS